MVIVVISGFNGCLFNALIYRIVFQIIKASIVIKYYIILSSDMLIYDFIRNDSNMLYYF